ncbi:MAG: RES family NAD+ phosphorylase [Acidiferrobacterales bacterium]|nr:RES family NAD+ phosphorylase [Acidiferrobacterales bacterium]
MLDSELFNQKSRLSSYHGKVWRMVETQETAATLNIVDSMEEQSLLEELLDEAKPPYRSGTENMHYLLKTAFRYPPLKHGSRFGNRTMPSFFYASETIQTVLAETAYYRFVFLYDMQDQYANTIDSKHCLFNVSVRTKKCLNLCSKKYSPIRAALIDIKDYSYCQAIGDWAVTKKSTELIRFYSARHYQQVNIAVAEPKTIVSKSPNSMQSWLCRTSAQRISFSSREADNPISFSIEDFTVDDTLPRPSP